MIDLKAIKSAEVINDYSKVESTLMDSHRKFVEAVGENPAALAATEFLHDENDGLVIAKRNPDLGVILDTAAVPAIDTLKQLASKRGIKWKDGYENRIKAYYASDERPDRHGDIAEQTWNFSDYETNPLFLYGHGWDKPPIGTALHWEVGQRSDAKYKGDALKLLNLFADKDTWEFADTIFRLTDGGFMRTGSVGFRPGEIITVKDESDRKKLGLGPFGHILRNNKLIEFSAVSVPANPGAHTILNSMRSKGTLRSRDVQVIRELKRLELERAGLEKEWTNFDAATIALWKSLFPEVAVAPHKELDVTLLGQELEGADDNSDDHEDDDQPATKGDLRRLDEQLRGFQTAQGEMVETLNDIRRLAEHGSGFGKRKEDEQQQPSGDSRVDYIAGLLGKVNGNGE